jgi:hypothetical protein
MTIQLSGEQVERIDSGVQSDQHSEEGHPLEGSHQEQLMAARGSAVDTGRLVIGSSLGRCAVWLGIAAALALMTAATAESVHEVVICALVALFAVVTAALSLRACLQSLRFADREP